MAFRRTKSGEIDRRTREGKALSAQDKKGCGARIWKAFLWLLLIVAIVGGGVMALIATGIIKG